jgi:hypothetical protein
MTGPARPTPGPWRLESGAEPGQVSIIGADGLLVADLEEANWARQYEGSVTEANAKLLAAAWELLEALQAMVDASDDTQPSGVSTDARTKARAAIAKATIEMFPRSRATIRAALEAVRAELDGEYEDGPLKAPEPRRSAGVATKRKAPKRR